MDAGGRRLRQAKDFRCVKTRTVCRARFRPNPNPPLFPVCSKHTACSFIPPIVITPSSHSQPWSASRTDQEERIGRHHTANARSSLAVPRASVPALLLRFALSGASVWLVGRNESKATEVLDLLSKALCRSVSRRRASTKSPAGSAEHHFFQADLSSTSGVKKVAKEITDKAGKGGVDYPDRDAGWTATHGAIEVNAEGVEKQFAVQVLSRVGLAKELVEAGTIKRSVFMIAAPGQGGKSPIDVDDLDFVKAKQAASGVGWSPGFG